MNTVNIKIKGTKNIREIYQLFKEHKTKHWPIHFVEIPDVYQITLSEGDPMVSFLELKYGVSQNCHTI